MMIKIQVAMTLKVNKKILVIIQINKAIILIIIIALKVNQKMKKKNMELQ